MSVLFSFLWLTTFIFIIYTSESLDLLQSQKNAFEQTFHDRCDKYPFVSQYINKLEKSDERYFVFVYQENGLRNGGLGDKIGGLVSAVAMALRFNRTLILRSNNDMHEVFRPYHPTDIHSETPKYSWTNITSWSNFNPEYANNDATEYDLYDCINNTGQKNAHCSMKDGDARTPHILYRSNRAYLCYYDNNEGSVANQQMNDILGVNKSSDLYEVAGCMLRLALWPTETLWQEVSKQLIEFEHSLSDESAVRFPASRRQLRNSHNNIPLSNQHSSHDHDYTSSKHKRHLQRYHQDHQSHQSYQSRALMGSAGVLNNVQKVVQVGMHFRCGDRSYIQHGGFDHMCVYEGNEDEHALKEKFPLGSPVEIGLCASRSLHSYITGLMEDRGSVASGMGLMDTPPLSSTPTDAYITQTDEIFTMAFIASDNLMASLQMNMTLGVPRSIVSPQGCHIEMDPSKRCHLFTATQWFTLALSDILVTQSQIPSSFSRYAGIYGLKQDPFRNGQDCAAPYNSKEYSRKPISNWFC
eukprot:CAMPEP_0170370138 /NCGR_PEP_ID=MMETSP0117_2-20130122/8355_1 /TAXON_ID=400756 /ORGANISM="Durinskia baltica, Strain CSIRO CS-38" /LENGTH=524 /DNA_ID=CAMNT_0010624901 /DNA_START=49 /DNA_END=1623 /DNA_ORIENTATION=+